MTEPNQWDDLMRQWEAGAKSPMGIEEEITRNQTFETLRAAALLENLKTINAVNEAVAELKLAKAKAWNTLAGVIAGGFVCVLVGVVVWGIVTLIR